MSWSFCDLTTRTRLLAYINILEISNWIDWKASGWTLRLFRFKATVLNCFTALRCPKDVFRGLWTLIPSPIITLYFQWGIRVTQPVTSLRCFGRAKMAANFRLTRSTSNGWKSSFHSPYAKKKFAVFPSKVQTLSLSKNVTCENFVSVAL